MPIDPPPRPLVIGCGALVSELRPVLAQLGLESDVDVTYLPANLHNRPDRIVPAITDLLDGADPERPIFLAYADCGTGGDLDRLVDERPTMRRLPGAHCYEFLAGADRFAELQNAEPGTFYLTDFLAKHFEPLVWQGLGLDRHPELLAMYFGNYTRVVLLSQSDDPAVVAAGEAAARSLGLRFEHHHVGREPFRRSVDVALQGSHR